jgi:protein O-mannosyl-transferase
LMAFALGLMAKPMLVTLPLVLLMLDYWPLGRMRAGDPLSSLILEKAPLFALSIASSVITWIAQRTGGAMADLQQIPFSARAENAVASYASYIGKMLWPRNLAVAYPYSPKGVAPYIVAGAALFLAAITFAAVRARHRYPYLIVGWLWYVVTLIPVIGLVQVGRQSMADRYTYIPLIGLFVAIAWGVPELLARRRALIGIASACAIVALMACTYFQVQTWRNADTLFQHAVEAVPDNYLAYNILGIRLREQGRVDDSIASFSRSISLNPADVAARTNLGAELAAQGKVGDAIYQYREALKVNPSYAEAHSNLGAALVSQGKLAEATNHFLEAVRIRPDYLDAINNLGVAYARQGRIDQAIVWFRRAVEINPDYAEAYSNLAKAYFSVGKYPEAWRAVHLSVKNGGRLPANLLRSLAAKVPEPQE